MQKELESKKYTFIYEYKGGTYIAQFDAKSLEESVIIWLNNMDNRIFPTDIIIELKENFLSEIYSLQPINGIDNVWSTSYTIYDELLLLNIVLTSSSGTGSNLAITQRNKPQP